MRRGAAALALLAALAGGGAAAQTVGLGRAEARALGAQAMQAGDAGLAREVARGLIAADAGDRDGWLLLAAAELGLGRTDEAARAAGEAHRLSGTPSDRYEAARVAALIARRDGRFLAAEWWLRRALLAAANPEEADRTRADARAVRAQAPWQTELSFSVTPSDNVNGGSESPYSVVDGLPFVGTISVDGRALSGWAATLDAAATRRLGETRTSRTRLGFHLYGRAVRLSDEARDLIREETKEGEEPVEAGDFTYLRAETSLSHERVVAERALVGARLTLGSTWSGGDPYSRTAEMALQGQLPLAGGQRLGAEASVRAVWYDGADRADLPLGLTLDWSVPMPNRDRLTLAATVEGTWSDNGNAASESATLSASYALARPVGPARLSASLGVQRVEYPDYAVLFPVPGGRRDDRRFASVQAAFVDWSVAGFMPVVTVQGTSTQSNVSRFEGDSLTVGLAVRSTF